MYEEKKKKKRIMIHLLDLMTSRFNNLNHVKSTSIPYLKGYFNIFQIIKLQYIIQLKINYHIT